MTQAPLELVDPGSAFLASGDPERFLEDNLPSTDEPQEREDTSHVRAVVLIAGAFIAWRLYALAAGRREIPAPPMDAESALHLLWRKHAPIWLRVAQPVISEIMVANGLTGQEMEAVAADYAARLGKAIHESSTTAVVAGYQEQLRRGVNPTLSWLRAFEGYGLDERRLRSWVAQQAVQEGPVSDLVRPSSQRALEKAMLARADVLGQTEAWHARQVAKSVAWMVAEREGKMPVGTRKRWLTAEDERVCKVCGPLHLQEVWLSQQFVLPSGERLWAPGVHPNCRCELALVYPSYTFEKAAPGDPYDRDAQGQFARQESRQRKVVRPYAEPAVADPTLLAMLERIKAGVQDEPSLLDQESLFEEPSLLNTDGPSLLDGPSLFSGGPSLLDGDSLLDGGPSLKVKTTGRKRRLIILVNGQPREVDADQISDDDDHMIFLPADKFFAQQNLYRPRVPGEPAEGVPDLKVGDTLDFDEFAVEAALEHHGATPMPVEAFIMRPGDHPNTVIRRLDDFYHFADDLSREDERLLQNVWDMENNVLENATYEADDIIDHLPDYDLHEVFRNAGQRNLVKTYSDTELREMLKGAVKYQYGTGEGLEDTNLAMALQEAWFQHIVEEDEDIRATRLAVDETLGAGFLRMPQIFTFEDNHVDGYVVDDSRPLIMGKYVVSNIKIHRIDNSVERENPRVLAWKEVVLSRVHPTTDDLSGYDRG